jgi:hypothetical protein
MASAFNRTECDGVDHEPRLEARLDGEQPADLPEHRHSLTPERLNGRFAPFRA